MNLPCSATTDKHQSHISRTTNLDPLHATASHNPPIIKKFQDHSKKFHQLRSCSVTSSLSEDPKPQNSNYF